jgi:hypothetical protein
MEGENRRGGGESERRGRIGEEGEVVAGSSGKELGRAKGGRKKFRKREKRAEGGKANPETTERRFGRGAPVARARC